MVLSWREKGRGYPAFVHPSIVGAGPVQKLVDNERKSPSKILADSCMMPLLKQPTELPMKTHAHRKEGAKPDKGGPSTSAAQPDVMPPAMGAVMPGAMGSNTGHAKQESGAGQAKAGSGRLPVGLVGRANRVLGMDLSDVEVIIDPALAAQGKNGAAENGTIIRLAPHAANDSRVIWHEMTHIVQQRGGNAGGKGATSERKSLEREAEAGAKAGQSDEPMSVGAAATREPLYDDGQDVEKSEGMTQVPAGRTPFDRLLKLFDWFEAKHCDGDWRLVVT